jgi:hypothetical protein
MLAFFLVRTAVGRVAQDGFLLDFEGAYFGALLFFLQT